MSEKEVRIIVPRVKTTSNFVKFEIPFERGVEKTSAVIYHPLSQSQGWKRAVITFEK